MRKAGRHISKSIRQRVKRQNQQIANEALALFPSETSDPVADSLFGTQVNKLKNSEIDWRFKMTAQERSNLLLKNSISSYKGRARRHLKSSKSTKIHGGPNESALNLRERNYMLDFSQDRDFGWDYSLTYLPKRLQRFTAGHHEVQEDPARFNISKALTQTEQIQEYLDLMENFGDNSSLWDYLSQTELVATNLAPGFSLSDLDLEGNSATLVQSNFNIDQTLASVRLSFPNKLSRDDFKTKYQNKRIKSRKLKIFTNESTDKMGDLASRTVVFFGLPDHASESEILLSLSQFGNITGYHCPRLESDGVLPKTSELIRYLREKGSLRKSNVSAMELGVDGWQLIRLSEEKGFKAQNIDKFLESTIANLIEENESQQYYLRKDYEK